MYVVNSYALYLSRNETSAITRDICNTQHKFQMQNGIQVSFNALRRPLPTARIPVALAGGTSLDHHHQVVLGGLRRQLLRSLSADSFAV